MKPSVLWKSDKKLFFGPQGFTRETFGKTLRSFFAGLSLKQTLLDSMDYLFFGLFLLLPYEFKTQTTHLLFVFTHGTKTFFEKRATSIS